MNPMYSEEEEKVHVFACKSFIFYLCYSPCEAHVLCFVARYVHRSQSHNRPYLFESVKSH